MSNLREQFTSWACKEGVNPRSTVAWDAYQAGHAAGRAEAEALLTFIRPYVYGLDNIKRIDAFLKGDTTWPTENS